MPRICAHVRLKVLGRLAFVTPISPLPYISLCPVCRTAPSIHRSPQAAVCCPVGCTELLTHQQQACGPAQRLADDKDMFSTKQRQRHRPFRHSGRITTVMFGPLFMPYPFHVNSHTHFHNFQSKKTIFMKHFSATIVVATLAFICSSAAAEGLTPKQDEKKGDMGLCQRPRKMGRQA